MGLLCFGRPWLGAHPRFTHKWSHLTSVRTADASSIGGKPPDEAGPQISGQGTNPTAPRKMEQAMGGFVGTDSADTRTDPNGRYAADADQHSPADQQGTRSRISFEHQEAMVKPYLFTDEAMNADNNGTAATNMPTLTIATLANTAELTRPTQAVIEPWTNQLGSWHKQGEPAATKLQPCQTAPRVPWPPPPLPPKLTLTLWSAPLTQQTQTRSEERRVGKEYPHWCRSRWSPYH